MSRYSSDRYAGTIHARRRVKRRIAIGVMLLTALALTLSLAIRPSAYAASKAGAQRANDMVAGQVSKADSATVLVYMNGSDLESEGAEASYDIAEML